MNLTAITSNKAKYTITDEDAKKIILQDYSEHVSLWITSGPTRDTTNKMIYQFWQNAKLMDTGDHTAYGHPEVTSPYCTHAKGHWDYYSHKAYKEDPKYYKQYWYFKKVPNVNYATGDLTNPAVQKVFAAMKGKGPDTLICMNDSINEMLNRKDVSFKSFSDIDFGDEVDDLQKKKNFLLVQDSNDEEFQALIFSENSNSKKYLFLKNEIPAGLKSTDIDLPETYDGNIRIEADGWQKFLNKSKNLKTINGTLTCVDRKMEFS